MTRKGVAKHLGSFTEYNEQGGRRKSYIYGGSGLLATGDQTGLLWHHNNPVTGDGRRTDAQGKLVVAAYLDPQGVDAGASDPAVGNGEPLPLESLPEVGAYAAFLPRSLGGSGRCTPKRVSLTSKPYPQ